MKEVDDILDTAGDTNESDALLSEPASEYVEVKHFPIRLELKQPVPIYRGRSTNCVHAFSSKILYITGDAIKGFYPVISNVPGYGKVTGFARCFHIGNI